MPSQDWRRIEGAVTACYWLGKQRRFDSLVEALRFHGGSTWNHPPTPKYYRDENGIVIPDWKLEEVAAHNAEPPRWIANWARHHPHVFRQGPVPGVWSRRGGRHHRHLATTQERRANEFLRYDDDAIEYGIAARGRRSGYNLPTAWDDIPDSRRGDGWKNYRRTQYRT